ncbi:hypothetical protein ACS0TY_008058 [Phlomoides rotata]
MAISKLWFMLFLTIVSANNFLLVFTSAQCQGDLEGLIQHCGKYVQKSGPNETPSKDCCNVVSKVNLPCVCDHVTPDVEHIISLEKAMFVAASCGKPVPHGIKCGSYTVPPVELEMEMTEEEEEDI